MVIELTDKLFLNVDSRNYTLNELIGTKDKKGNPKYKTHGYFATLSGSLEEATRLEVIRGEDKMSLQKYIEQTKEIQDKFKDMTKGL